MAAFRKIAVMDDVVQAQMMELMLKERNIPHAMHSYHDSAYDGLFQEQKGWGYIEASEEHEPEILSLLNALKGREE
jgi:hypothetical protein